MKTSNKKNLHSPDVKGERVGMFQEGKVFENEKHDRKKLIDYNEYSNVNMANEDKTGCAIYTEWVIHDILDIFINYIDLKNFKN
jgi:hypothetical protein